MEDDEGISQGRKIIGISAIVIVVFILIASFILESYSSEDAKDIYPPLKVHFKSITNLSFLAVALVGIGILSWLVVSRIMFKDRMKKKEVSSSRKGFRLK